MYFNVNECKWVEKNDNANHFYLTKEKYDEMIKYCLVSPSENMIQSFLLSLKELAIGYSFLYGDTLSMKSDEVYKMLLRDIA